MLEAVLSRDPSSYTCLDSFLKKQHVDERRHEVVRDLRNFWTLRLFPQRVSAALDKSICIGFGMSRELYLNPLFKEGNIESFLYEKR